MENRQEEKELIEQLLENLQILVAQTVLDQKSKALLRATIAKLEQKAHRLTLVLG
ncbi:hypothetical protein OAO01_00530 [Oligoflexia bacterium]|nr:hypothetical protein [Oligoflexia bacterium]